MKTVTYIDVQSIQPNPLNPRKYFDEEYLKELSKSISKVGVLQPITVRLSQNGYELICGERRWRAAVIAKLESVPAIIRKLSDEEAMDIMITENLQRKDIDPFEEADAFSYLLKKGQSYEEIAARFGKSVVFVRGRVKLNDLIYRFRKLHAEKIIPVSHCLELCKLPSQMQEEVSRYYNKGYNGFEDYSITRLKKSLSSLMSNMDKANFDQTECKTCPKNTAYLALFPDLETVSCIWIRPVLKTNSRKPVRI